MLGALGRWASRVLGGTGAPALALLFTLGLFLFPAALLGGKVLSPSDSVLFAPPFAPEPPATLTHPSNPALNDVTVLFEDHLAQARHAIRQGHLPLWNPQVGAGRPLGGAQGAPLFPTSWLAYVLPFWTSLAWIALAKLLLAGVGMALFCRAVGLGRAAALLGGVAFAFSTLYVTYLGHGHTADFGLAPWALFAAERLAAGGGARSTLGLGLAVGLALYSGHPETSLLVILLAYAYLTFRLDERRRAGESLRVLRKPVALGLASGVLGIFIGALALTALLDVTGESLRLSRSGSLHVSLRDMFVGATLPELWGRPDKTVFRAGTFQVFSSFFHGRVYLGVVPLLLGAIGFVRRPAPRQVFFAAVAVVSLLAALGGVAHSILRHLPGLALVGSFQYLWPLTVAGAVLAAYGAQRALDPDPVTRRRAPIVGGVLVTAAVIAALGARPHLLEQLASGVKDIPTLRHGEASADAAAAGSLMRFLLLAGAGLGLVVLARHGAWRRWAAIGMITFTAGDLLLVDRGWWPAVPQDTVAPPAPASLRTVRLSGAEWRVAGLSNALTPDLSERYGLRDARVYDLPETKRYSKLFASLGGTVLPGFGETLLFRTDASQRKLLALLATRWVIDDGPPAPVPAGLRARLSRPGDRLLENPEAFPRAWIAYGARPAHGLNDALRQIVAAPARSLRDTPVVEGVPTGATVAVSSRPAKIRSSTDTRVEVAATGRAPGWLVLADLFHPGWKATVDGRATPIHAANAAFRAVRLPAGAHRVVFTYAPGRIIAAAWVSCAAFAGALLVLLALTLAVRRRSGGVQTDEATGGPRFFKPA